MNVGDGELVSICVFKITSQAIQSQVLAVKRSWHSGIQVKEDD